MATTTDTPEDAMTAQRWFDQGGQQAELQRIGKIKNSDQQMEALAQFNERNNGFMAERTAQAQSPPLPQRPERAKTHPAIEAAIDDTMKKETGWMREMAGLSDEQLRERRLNRHMDQDRNRGRLDPSIVTLSEYKVARPDVVDVVGKFTRAELERKEILTRMVQERRFNREGRARAEARSATGQGRGAERGRTRTPYQQPEVQRHALLRSEPGQTHLGQREVGWIQIVTPKAGFEPRLSFP
jgi:hypothetical protein